MFANARLRSRRRRVALWLGQLSVPRLDRRPASIAARSTRATCIEIYPDGFLPLINPIVEDASAAGGVRFALGDWDMDASLVYGSNKMDFTIRNTLNRSLGPASKTTFDAGGFQYQQVVANLSGVKQYDVGLASPLNVAAGVEARQEFYEIIAGEPDSYRNGGVLLGGAPTASGAQVFPGFRPANEVDDGPHRGRRLSSTSKPTSPTRCCSPPPFAASTIRTSARRRPARSRRATTSTTRSRIRGSVQNGFRAPSLQQQYFATTSTNFIGGVPFDVTTFPVNDPIAIALGAQPLEAEKSINYSLGGVIRLGDFNVTIDAYRIDIDNRIVLSENLIAAERP